MTADGLPPLHRDDVYEALRAIDSIGIGVRVAQIVRYCYGPEDTRDRYEKCHRKVSQRLRDLEREERAGASASCLLDSRSRLGCGAQYERPTLGFRG
jgi:hypothetical protein